jgi:hypothetical protein
MGLALACRSPHARFPIIDFHSLVVLCWTEGSEGRSRPLLCILSTSLNKSDLEAARSILRLHSCGF